MVVFTYNLGDAVGWLLIGVLLFLTYLGMVFMESPMAFLIIVAYLVGTLFLT